MGRWGVGREMINCGLQRFWSTRGTPLPRTPPTPLHPPLPRGERGGVR